MTVFIIYFFPFAMDIVLSLLLFVGRHSLASRGATETEVGSIPLLFGIGYFLAGPLMRKIISRRLAKIEMLVAAGGLALLSALLANTDKITNIQVLFFFVPIAACLFFNAFQAYMLGIATDRAASLSTTVSLYTFAWALGFALGPFVAGFLAERFSWQQVYYLAAVSSVVIGIIVLAYRPARPRPEQIPAPKARTRGLGPTLHFPGWLGMLIGLTAWMVIATYWPVIAAATEVSPKVKGLVEFAYAAALAFGALALIALKDWQHRLWLIPVFGLVGVGGLLVFGAADSTLLYVTGAALMGLHITTAFVFSAYHCMLNGKLAAKRIAVNEMMVGGGYIVGPLVASALHQEGQPFGPSFTAAAGLLALMVAVRTWWAWRIVSHSRRPG